MQDAAKCPKAAVFDLDGVVTRTARVHFAAWKQTFDELLAKRPQRSGVDLRPFQEADYRAHVDGKPRRQGIEAFLASRGIALPEASPASAREADTVDALSRRKNALFVSDGVHLTPNVPTRMHRARFRARHHARWFDVELTRERLRVSVDGADSAEVRVHLEDRPYVLSPDDALDVEIGPRTGDRPPPEPLAGESYSGPGWVNERCQPRSRRLPRGAR